MQLGQATLLAESSTTGEERCVNSASGQTLEPQSRQEEQQKVAHNMNSSTGLKSPTSDSGGYTSSTSTSPNLPNVAMLSPHGTPSASCLLSPCPSEDSDVNISGDGLTKSTLRGGQNEPVAVAQIWGSGHQTEMVRSTYNTASSVFETNNQSHNPQTGQIPQPMQTTQTIQHYPQVPTPSQTPTYPQAQMPHQMSPGFQPPVTWRQDSSRVTTNTHGPVGQHHPPPLTTVHSANVSSIQPGISPISSSQALPLVGPISRLPLSGSYFQKITNQLDVFENQYPPPNTATRSVFDVIRLAILKEDSGFLVIHQLFCLLSGPSENHPEFLVQNAKVKCMYSFLRDCINLSQPGISTLYRDFFSKFPIPFPELQARFPRSFEKSVQDFLVMVNASGNFEKILQYWHKRMLPPVVPELLHMHITSLVLQRRVFLLSLQHILTFIESSIGWRENISARNQFEDAFLGVFKQHQVDHSIFRPERANERNQSAGLYHKQFKMMVNTYNQNLLQARAHAQSQAQAQISNRDIRPPPPLANVTHPTPGFVQNQNVSCYIFPPTSVHSNPAGSVQRAPNVRQVENSQQIQRVPNAQQVHQIQHIQNSQHIQHVQLIQHVQRVQPHNTTVVHRDNLASSLLPNKGTNRQIVVNPNPVMFALHQAHLRSPTLKAQESNLNLYQFVKGCAFDSPRRLTVAVEQVEEWAFTVTDNMLNVFPSIVKGQHGAPPIRFINKESETLRLRCIKWNSPNMPDDHIWATADTSWIPNAFFSLNGSPLEMRKKINYGKDLPVDITQYIQKGSNVLQIAVLSDDQDSRNYVFGIEVVSAITHEDIKLLCNTKHSQSAKQVLTAIKSKLSGYANEDELVFVKSSLTISLVDPFTASKMCDIPVRAQSCLHDECFDLETFLVTRPRKGDMSDSGKWLCPICRGDARPHRLMVNGFHQQVRKELEERGLAETRAIIVEQDGSWAPKTEPDKGGPTPHSTEGRRQSAKAAPQFTNVFAIPEGMEVIDLDD